MSGTSTERERAGAGLWEASEQLSPLSEKQTAELQESRRRFDLNIWPWIFPRGGLSN